MKPYYDPGGVTLYLGDCREVLPALDSVDHVITDPPYSEDVHSKSRAGSRKLDDTGFISDYSRAVDFGFDAMTADLLNETTGHVARLVKRWALVFSDSESAHIWRRSLQADGLDYVRTGAWHKLNPTPQFTGDRPAVGFETITMAHPKGRKRWNGGGLPGIWSHAVVNNRGDGDPRCHPTQKPLPLMLDLVRLFTDPGETILDMFAGSGTLGAAARQLGRRAILIESDEEHCETAARRCERAQLGVQEAFAL